ncbi:hypothetical protein HPB50_000611 [Hyalomma asiaticum]|uniref:Uncharacterized protein n=1 Tax=Hyalomma asiaticum TaxID=266040 RepID=A0ACB7RGS6_HYAAI|nr:hypothetical protein HPB50_000611 [Hyalomma asiaticum]
MSAKRKSRYETLPYRCLTWLFSKIDVLSPQNNAINELASTLSLLLEWSFGSWQKLKHFKMPSTSTESASRRTPSVNFGSVSRLQSPVPRREGVMLRCYRSNSSVKGSGLRPVGQCGSRASSDTASRQCSPIPESVESDISLLKEEVASLRKQFEELVTSQKGKQEGNESGNQRPRDPCTEQAAKSHEAMLAEVLKGLGTVKLKKVEKSPSGTPLRKCGESESDTDPAGMLARALKKRFVHIHPPESSDDSAAEAWSPSSPDVQVKRRTTGSRRLSSRRNLEMSTVASPMQEVGPHLILSIQTTYHLFFPIKLQEMLSENGHVQCDKQKEALNQACTPAAHAPGPINANDMATVGHMI